MNASESSPGQVYAAGRIASSDKHLNYEWCNLSIHHLFTSPSCTAEHQSCSIVSIRERTLPEKISMRTLSLAQRMCLVCRSWRDAVQPSPLGQKLPASGSCALEAVLSPQEALHYVQAVGAASCPTDQTCVDRSVFAGTSTQC